MPTPFSKPSPARGARRSAAILVIACLLLSPLSALAKKGEKNYKQGLQHEGAQQWEKAAEEFSLAVAAEPSNSEYQLHYRRAVFNASQAFMQQGGALMERGDYLGAYNAFRRAYGYDPSNELAASMMKKAFRLQTDKGEPVEAQRRTPDALRPQTGARLRQTAYEDPANGARRHDETLAAPRSEQLQAIQYNGDLEKFVRYLARQIRLNVVFDRDFPRREVSVDLIDVTAAQALDYIFLAQGLFFQKLSARTIVVADQAKRPQYQQLMLRTFYLYNVDPNDAKQLIQASMPPQAGRQPAITVNKSTNSVTVRDTPENVRLVGELLRSIDKERAEVVMDVNIFEVSREDLVQFGNQIGTGDTLANLGGIQKGLSVIGGSRQVVTQALSAIPTALGAAFIVPPTALTALQRRDNTRLVASTQVHAFDGEKSTAHIGQRVPVQTASVTPYGSVSTGDGNNPQQGATQGLFGGNGYPVIQYEKTGLTLEFTPQVFPNLDVQVKMSIKSNDVTKTTGAAALTPTFTERNIEGTARIQNNRTMMIASVAQNQQSRGRQGLPVLGLVPILGQMFTAPRREDSQTDIVIAVTPHVMRASSVTPEDEKMRPSGTQQTPTSGTLEAMLEEVSREEQFAAVRAVPRNTEVEVTAPVEWTEERDEGGVSFVPAPKSLLPAAGGAEPVSQTTAVKAVSLQASAAGGGPVSGNLFERTADLPAQRVNPGPGFVTSPASSRSAAGVSPAADKGSAAQLTYLPKAQVMYVGERRRGSLLLKTGVPLASASFALRFDPRVVRLRVAEQADDPSAPAIQQTLGPDGLLTVTVASKDATLPLENMALLLLEVEAIAEGVSDITFVGGALNFTAPDGRKFVGKSEDAHISVRR